jgi:hypothetical protein
MKREAENYGIQRGYEARLEPPRWGGSMGVEGERAWSVLAHLLISAEASKLWNNEPHEKDAIE